MNFNCHLQFCTSCTFSEQVIHFARWPVECFHLLVISLRWAQMRLSRTCTICLMILMKRTALPGLDINRTAVNNHYTVDDWGRVISTLHFPRLFKSMGKVLGTGCGKTYSYFAYVLLVHVVMSCLGCFHSYSKIIFKGEYSKEQ